MTGTVIGFDGSLTASGIARWRDGLWTFETVRTGLDDPRTPAVEDRWGKVLRRLRGYLTDPPDRTLVVIEGVFQGQLGRTALDLAMLHAVVRYRLQKLGAPFAVVAPQHLKQFATGRGNATKTQMLEAARERLGLALTDDNQCDALWLAAMGLARYGAPLCTTTTVQDSARNAARWPLWNLTDDRAAAALIKLRQPTTSRKAPA